jgi:small-conductance mechanosensitive channel
LFALASLGLIAFVIYKTWIKPTLSEEQGIKFLLWLAPVYIVSVFLFSFGYETYNLLKALRLTAIIVVITVFVVIIIAVLFALTAAKEKMGSTRSSSSKSSSSGSPAPSSHSDLRGIGRVLPVGLAAQTADSEEQPAPEAPPAPQPVVCPSCGRSYVPAENSITCPRCGA